MLFDFMPVPAEVSAGDDEFIITEAFSVVVLGASTNRINIGTNNFLRRLANRTGLFLQQTRLGAESGSGRASLQLICDRSAKLELGEVESYRLQVDGDGIRLEAETDLGILHGLETLLQHISGGSAGYVFSEISIVDQPRFPWRGLMIDSSRHFMPLSVIRRNIAGMAAVKMNVFHWHLSDDQGFRVESKRLPKLNELGSNGEYYSQLEVKEIVAYANSLGIRVVPEIDMPGHVSSWLAGYPELASADEDYAIEKEWGIFKPVLDPTKKTTYEFLDILISEMSELFPDDYFHIGGDEVEGDHWDANDSIQKYMAEQGLVDNGALQNHFNVRLLEIISKYNKKMVGWDEILHCDMPDDIVIQSWRGKDSMAEAAQKGYRSLLSNGYYIDLGYPTDFYYLNDPLPKDTELNVEQQSNVLGGEATMWSEFITAENIDSRIWPRLAAIAERLWSPAAITDVDDMYRRLGEISIQLEEHGLTHEKNYEMMMRRLVGHNDVTALRNMVDLLEPLKEYERGKQRKFITSSPLTRCMDIARPDARIPREFRQLVTEYLAGEGDNALSDKIRLWLEKWRNNHASFELLTDRAPVLEEFRLRSKNISQVAQLALKALDVINGGGSKKMELTNVDLTLIEDLKRSVGGTELMILPGIINLIDAARR